MVTLGIDGLASGLDTTSIISSLMKVEARPQDLLKTQLSAAQAKATAYRAVNTRFDAIRSAAEALTAASLQAARSATSSSSSVTATASAAALNGSISFTPLQAAQTQSVLSNTTWSSATAPITTDEDQLPWPIQIITNGTVTDTISIPAGASLVDVVGKINAAGYGFQAQVVETGTGEYRIKIDAGKSGTAGAFTIALTKEDPDNPGARVPDNTAFRTLRPPVDAQIDLGDGFLVSSSSNTFANLMNGVDVTIGKFDNNPVTVTVGSDTSATTAKVKQLVDAVNGALGVIKGFTQSTAGAAVATLQGDRALIGLSDQVLTAVSSAIGGKSAATIGLQLNKDGTIAFDASVFAAKLASDPTTVNALLSGTAATTTNGVTTPAVDGIAGKLLAVAKAASDSSTGTLVQLANGRDSLADALQDRIDAFDIRLEARKATLTKQFTTLETALNTIKNQSSWLSSQIGQLYNPNKSS